MTATPARITAVDTYDIRFPTSRELDGSDAVCAHAGGVGLCELVQHLAMFDCLALSGTTDDRVIEYVDHLHEHFTDPVVMREGHYVAPLTPGFSATMHPASLAEYRYPDGTFWAADLAERE